MKTGLVFLVPQIQTDETIGLCNLPFRTDLFANIQCPRGLKATDFFFFWQLMECYIGIQVYSSLGDELAELLGPRDCCEWN